jgi:hypothetical protein
MAEYGATAVAGLVGRNMPAGAGCMEAEDNLQLKQDGRRTPDKSGCV